MFENWFAHMNAYILSHPHWIAKLDFLLRVKCGLLTALMGVFVYLLYKEQRKTIRKPQKSPYHFIA
ncbi:hypothetical protein [Methylocaldum szegediense]|jgi:hypothetical protein|uniref:Uncharacterized protein n=1 Tax=Methylocaldum szegediense TaxID=73780 RepID=A0ABM9I7J5_9GAMM|nr:hypothetical protein [Methylocaldum szegediense]CAI8939986.1 conserved protein of unknown function [Methylocaldum szegediense]